MSVKLTPRLEMVNLLQMADEALTIATNIITGKSSPVADLQLAGGRRRQIPVSMQLTILKNGARGVRYYLDSNPQLQLELFKALNPNDARVQESIDRKLHEIREKKYGFASHDNLGKISTHKTISKKQRRPVPWSGIR